MDNPILNHLLLAAPINQADNQAITFTQLSARQNLHLTKRFDLAPDRTLIKSPAEGLGRSNYSTIRIATMEEFPAILNSTKHNQAHLYGVCVDTPSGQIVPESLRRPEIPTEKSRTKEFFQYPSGPGIVTCDIDVPQTGIPFTKNQIVDALVSVFPLMRTTCVVHAYSASSFLYDEESGEELLGARGQRICFCISDGRDISRVFSVIIARLYLAGFGRYEISAAGSLLERSLIDKALATPTQPDFCGGAACGVGVVQKRPPAESLWSGEPLNSSIAFPDLTPDERRQYDEMRRLEREKMAPEAATVRHQWFIKRSEEFIPVLLKRNGLSPNKPKDIDSARAEAVHVLTKALNYDTLESDFVIRFKDGTASTVHDVLRRRDQFHGQICLDPLEPEYDGGRPVGKLYLNGKSPNLHSLAHGGKTYFLAKHRVKILSAPGELAACIEDTLSALRDEPRIFLLGSTVVRVLDDGTLQFFTPATLVQFIGSEYRYYKDGVDTEGNPVEIPVNPSPLVGKTIVELGESCNLKKLNTVLTTPSMLPSGRLLMTPGFDEETGLFIQITPDDWPTIPVAPSLEELREAYDQFFKPLSQYPWKDALSKGVALSMMLTAITRAGMRIAPGFAVQASTQSSGKTFAIQAAAALISGEMPPVTSIDEAGSSSDGELRKALISVAMTSKKEYLIDNVDGYFENSALAACLTGGMIEGRILGSSRMTGSLPFRVFFGVSGNNIQLGPDLCQRLLVAEIDPGTEAPELREFQFNPITMAIEDRHKIVAAGLILLQGFVTAGMPKVGSGTARFSEWDKLIRQAVIWLKKTLCLDIADPLESVAKYKKQDSEQENLFEFLRLWHRIFHEKPLTSGELHRFLEELQAEHDNLRKDDLLHRMNGNNRDFLTVIKAWSRNEKIPNVRSLGNILRNRKGRRVSGYLLDNPGTRHNGLSAWQVRFESHATNVVPTEGSGDSK